MKVKLISLFNHLSNMRDKDIKRNNVAVMHYGEIFKVREIAYATKENAKDLGLKPNQMYLVIN